MKLRITMIVALMATLLVYTIGQAQDVQPTATPDHTAHHPSVEATTTPFAATPNATPDTSQTGQMGQMGSGGMDMQSMMQDLSKMMDDMLKMDMPENMKSMMLQMRGMLAVMMSDMDSQSMMTTMQAMGDMMDDMMQMNMSAEMMSMMQQMQGMMDMMMGGAQPGDTMGGMEMGGSTEVGGHAMGPISSEGVPAATEDSGAQPLDYRLEDGVKVFEITTRPVIWNILDDVTVTAWTYNGTVPGPMIRVTEGDQVRILVKNELPEPTTVHWHGIAVPNAMDGVPGITQDPIQPGETFTYEFVAKPAGTFMYHSHVATDVQVGLGLYAPFIIDPAQPEEPVPDVDVTLMISEWRVMNGQTFPAMPRAGAEPNYFTINGKAFPATETINVKLGQRVRLRLAGIGQFLHPMHLHGLPFQIVATDGHPVPETARLTKDTVMVGPGERYDIEFIATEPGQWAFHCHIPDHLTNDGLEPGGLMAILNVSE